MTKYNMKVFEETIKFFKESKQLYWFDEYSCVFYKVTDVWSIIGRAANVCLDNNTRELAWTNQLMTAKEKEEFIKTERYKDLRDCAIKRLEEKLEELR